MKNFNELKKVFKGEVYAVLCFRVFMEVYAYFTGTSLNWGWEETWICVGWLVFSIVMTYIAYTLGSGISADVKELKKLIKSKMEAMKKKTEKPKEA